jgi:hypothetical protein
LSCKLKTPLLPAQTAFGYSIKSADWKEAMFGKRNLDAELNLPTGRTLKVEYNGQRASPVDTDFDDDDDSNNDREFTSTSKWYWDFSRAPSKYIVLNAKRDNYAKTGSKLTLEVTNYPGVRSSKLTVDRQRLPSETDIKITAEYELASNAKNKLELTAKMSSDLDSHEIRTEVNLDEPKFNIAYDSRFNKFNGRLQHYNLRLAQLLQFTVQKDDPANRKISASLVSPDASRYTAETKIVAGHSRHYVLESTLTETASGKLLATLTSQFCSTNNKFDIEVKTGNGVTYNFNLGIYNETVANAYLLRNGERVMVEQLAIHDHDGHKDLDLTVRWNRVWGQFKQDVLNGGQAVASDPKFNSYFGDVYGELSADLKPVVESIRAERKALTQELMQSFGLYVDYYKYYLPKSMQDGIAQYMKNKQTEMAAEEKERANWPLYKRVFVQYNSFAEKINSLNLRVRSVSERLAKVVPRLPTIKYNQEANGKYANNLVISRATLNAHSLYQFYAEYRESVRATSNRIQSLKGSLLRNTAGYSLRSLWNKYKYRSFRAYTMIGHVFNGRNVITFNGEFKPLQATCKVLLAHDLVKNQFTVVLNENKKSGGVISVSAYGQPAIEISGKQAFVNDKSVSLPYSVSVASKSAQINVRRTNNGVSVEVNKDLLVTCYEDSNSCTVALTRWYTGKVSGLLGESTQNLANGNEDYWSLGGGCTASAGSVKKPTDDAVRACYSLFGKHRKSPFKNAFTVIKDFCFFDNFNIFIVIIKWVYINNT